MRTMTKFHVASLALVAAGLVISALAYGHLPDPVPTHWNAQGEVDGYIAKPLGAFLLPLTMLAIALLFMALPRISPKRFGMEGFESAYGWIIVATQAMLLFTTGLAHLAGMGFDVDIGRALSIATGLLLMVMGNFMGKVTRNFFLGIRTPWTLASEEVWLRTHRLGGKTLFFGGLAFTISALVGVHVWVLVPLIVLIVVIPYAYSFFLYRRLEGEGRAS
jgi:uncharacterized membrane protein